MNRANPTAIGIVTLAIMWVTPSNVAARACAPLQPIGVEYSQSSAVFLGRVASLRTEGTPTDLSRVYTIATFEVEKQWKGPGSRTIEVRTCGGGTVICTVGFTFQVGEKYLVFANGKGHETTSCGRTTTLRNATDTLNWLDRSKKNTG